MAGEFIFKGLEDAEPFLQKFFGSENLFRFFCSVYRSIRQQIPSAVIRGKDDEIIGISPEDAKYLFYIIPEKDLFYVKIRGKKQILLDGAGFNQIYNLIMDQVRLYREDPDAFLVKKKPSRRNAAADKIPDPKTDISFSDTGKVIDRETGEILGLEDRINTLGYYMAGLDEKKKLFESENAGLIDTINKLKTGLKEDFIQQGEGLVYGRVSISVSRPRLFWDVKGLAAYAEQHPEINVFQKTGTPVVSFRLLKEKQDTGS